LFWVQHQKQNTIKALKFNDLSAFLLVNCHKRGVHIQKLGIVFRRLYQLWFIMPQKIINLTMVNSDKLLRSRLSEAKVCDIK